MGLLAVGMLTFTQIEVNDSYATALLPGFLIVAPFMAALHWWRFRRSVREA